MTLPASMWSADATPGLDLGTEKRLQALMLEAAAQAVLRSAHDLSAGVLAVALAECCFRGDDLPPGLRDDVLLFSEPPSRIVVTARDESRLQSQAAVRVSRSRVWERWGASA